MSKLAIWAVAAGVLALTFVTFAPSSAEAGWRKRGGYWAPGVSVYVGPRWGSYAPRYRYYGRPYAYAYPYAYYPYWRGRYWRGWY
jgi:hypothetical protein